MSRRFRAFVSYSHADSKVARRLHADLERWRVDADLVGRTTEVGPVPPHLRPVFLDREDLAGGGQLSDVIRSALSQSMFLIVVCSPRAARSAYVDEEVRYFKGLGRAERVIPLIVDGEPGDPERECFPPALVRPIETDGSLGEPTDAPLAADAREHGDGRRRALIKVVAGLLGLSFDEIERRAERAQRRRTRLLSGVAALMFLLAVVAAGFAWLSETRRVAAEHNYQAAMQAADSLLGDIGEELTSIEGVTLETTRRVISRATNIYDELAQQLPDSPKLKVSRVAALAVFGKALNAKGDATAAIAAYERAERLSDELVSTNPDDGALRRLRAMLQWRVGAVLAAQGNAEAANARLESAFAVLKEDESPFPDDLSLNQELVSAAMLLGTLRGQRGDPEGAAQALAQASELAARLRDAAPDNWRYRLLYLTTRVSAADSQRQHGRLTEAMAAFSDLEAPLREELRQRPDMPQLRGLLRLVLESLASTAEALGDDATAGAARSRALATARRWTQGDLENRNAQREYAGANVRQAARRLRAGEIQPAIAQFAEARQVLDRQYQAASHDAGPRQSLLLALLTESGALVGAGYYAAAVPAARRLLALREQMLAEQPDSADAQHGLAAALANLAAALEQTDALPEALELRERGLALEQRLAASNSGEDRRLYLADAHDAVGLLNWRMSRRSAAIPHYEQRVALLRQLVAEEGEDRGGLEVSLGHALLNLGELRALTGDPSGARTAFVQSLEVRERRLAAEGRKPERLRELAWAEARLAQFGDAAPRRWQRVERLLAEADAARPLDDLEEELLTVARIVRSTASP